MTSGDPRRRNAPKKRPVKIQAEPLDLDQFEQEQADKEKEHLYTFKLGGVEFTIPPFGSLDRSLMDTADDDAEFMAAAFKMALGEDQFEVFDPMPLSLDGLNRLFKDWGEHSGMDVGK
jgi:hypothetical protein